MRAIALVGLVYLPGTFVSGLFGMNFFSFSDDNGQQKWTVSQNFRLYWIVVIPLTLMTVLVWVIALRGVMWKEKLTNWLAQLKKVQRGQRPAETQ